MHAREFHQNAITPAQTAPAVAVDATDPDDIAPRSETEHGSLSADMAAAMAEHDITRKPILVDFLHPKGNTPEPEPAPVPKPAPALVAEPTKKHSRVPAVIASVLVAALILGGTVAYGFYKKSQQVAVVTPAASPTPAPTPPAAEPPAAPPTAPAVTPPAANVTTPDVTPTKDHPQAVTVTSKSGLWIRSSPNSSNRDNIISWIPNGGSVSVDEVGDFWWHGTYNGVTGYFAANYTK